MKYYIVKYHYSYKEVVPDSKFKAIDEHPSDWLLKANKNAPGRYTLLSWTEIPKEQYDRLVGTVKITNPVKNETLTVTGFEGVSISGDDFKKDYEVLKVTDTSGGNLIVKLKDPRTGNEAEMILWKPGY